MICEGIEKRKFCKNLIGKGVVQEEDGQQLCKVCRKLLSDDLARSKKYTISAPRKPRKRVLSKWQFLQVKAKQLRKRPTKAEIIFERKLKELEIEYIFQYPFIFETIAGISDFYLKDLDVLVEIDGGYHLEQDQQQNDRVKDFVCEKKDKGVLRLTNNQAIYLSIEQIKTLIAASAKIV